MESKSDSETAPREQIMPDGIVELVLHYRDPFVTYQFDGTSSVQPANFAISQMRRFIEIESCRRIGFISVRFFPWGANHFFDTPIRGSLDGFAPTVAFWEP